MRSGYCALSVLALLFAAGCGSPSNDYQYSISLPMNTSGKHGMTVIQKGKTVDGIIVDTQGTDSVLYWQGRKFVFKNHAKFSGSINMQKVNLTVGNLTVTIDRETLVMESENPKFEITRSLNSFRKDKDLVIDNGNVVEAPRTDRPFEDPPPAEDKK